MTSQKKDIIPYILSGASLAISCYALYQTSKLSEEQKSAQENVKNEALIPLNNPPIRMSTTSIASANEDVCGTATLSRIMLPDDANSAGNVHGGTILKMIGHVGWLSATRFINRNIDIDNDQNEYRGVLVRMEEMNFKLPMFIGEICTCNAKVTFTANQSLEVQVKQIKMRFFFFFFFF